MASLYSRPRTPFWWIQYVDANGERRRESTRYRRDQPAQTREARELRREMTTREKTRSAQRLTGETWGAWVPRFIAQRWGESTLTRLRYQGGWRNLEAFLRAREIATPRELTRQQVRDYIGWRAAGDEKLGVHAGAKNTALLEIKLLGMIMAEATESGFAKTNPCLKLGIGREQAKIKPKITAVEHAAITRALKVEPEWMGIAYKIAWEQGCRFSETCLELRDVDLARNVIGFRTKGKKKAIAEVPLSPRLRPLFRRLIQARPKRERSFEMPKAAGKRWSVFFRKLGLAHLCFHCTRVTFITRCHEAGLPEPDVMRLVLHSSTTVHRIYPRLPAASDHLQQAMKRISDG